MSRDCFGAAGEAVVAEYLVAKASGASLADGLASLLFVGDEQGSRASSDKNQFPKEWFQKARRLNEHGLQETEDSIASKLSRGTFSATFLLACLTALELEGMRLGDL